MRPFVKAALAGGLLFVLSIPAHALPQYAVKEKKDCAYCHTSPSGGPLNQRGKYYAEHNHSFAGYSEETAVNPPKKTGPPSYKFAWRAEAPAGTSRVAVADLMGDKKPRLILLGNKTITIMKPTQSLSDKEATIDVTSDAGMYVGRFGKGKPAIIAVPGDVYYWNGTTFAPKAALDLTNIIGTVRFSDNTENIITAAADKPTAWGIDVTADKPLVTGHDLVPPAQGAGVYSEVIIHGSPDMLAAMGLPAEAQKAGVIGGFDPRGDKKFYGWGVWQADDGSYFTVADASAMTPGANPDDIKPVWRSPKLTGKVLDVALGPDPRNPKTTGILILEATGDQDKGRTLEFFTLD